MTENGTDVTDLRVVHRTLLLPISNIDKNSISIIGVSASCTRTALALAIRAGYIFYGKGWVCSGPLDGYTASSAWEMLSCTLDSLPYRFAVTSWIFAPFNNSYDVRKCHQKYNHNCWIVYRFFLKGWERGTGHVFGPFVRIERANS